MATDTGSLLENAELYARLCLHITKLGMHQPGTFHTSGTHASGDPQHWLKALQAHLTASAGSSVSKPTTSADAAPARSAPVRKQQHFFPSRMRRTGKQRKRRL